MSNYISIRLFFTKVPFNEKSSFAVIGQYHFKISVLQHCFVQQILKNDQTSQKIKYVNMPETFWNRIIWSDESKYKLKNAKRKRVWLWL